MSFVIPMLPVCWVSVLVAFIVIVRIDSLLWSPLISFCTPVLRTFTSKLILTFGASGFVGCCAGCWAACWRICARAFSIACFI